MMSTVASLGSTMGRPFVDFYQRSVVQPFYAAASWLASTPAGDPALYASLQGLGPPGALVSGAGQTVAMGLRYMASISEFASAGAFARVAESMAPQIHKNSLSYVGDTHVYAIRGPDGSLFKVGESAQGVRVTDGASIRAEQQARALQRETGEAYETEIRRTFGSKSEARAYETRFIQTYERLFNKRPPGNPLDR